MNLRNILVAFLLGLLVGNVGGQPLKVVTYNIRYDNPGDGVNSWTSRRVWLCEQIRSANPDLFGIQEGLSQQVKYFDSVFNGYRHVGVGREDGKEKGEFSAIYYNANKIRCLNQGTFWLSSTPEKVSVGWDAVLERICTFGLFKDIESGRNFWVFNTHFDHIGVEARKNSALLILKKIQTLDKQDYPVILMGDFNGPPDSDPIKIISQQLRDAKSADKSMSMLPDGTFNDFDSAKPVTERIDFIFTGKGAKAINYQVLRETKNGRFASDHFPVLAEISW
ncbi:MAG: endonuclease/exonuclease/phosphatase family protein [Bacteroidales bacterium]|nr:endonuclease/exonuclease/phosphatase family protein [Bacteroidales bacterium]MDD4604332.1 endonuclease/exonuclease/phosphatase family protein [Bacteroidales bacterium]